MNRRIWIGPAIAALAFAATAHGQEQRSDKASEASQKARGSKAPVEPYTTDIFRATESNSDFRRVLFTGERSQLVAMSIPPGESIGAEKHPHVEQTLVILRGSGQAVLDGEKTNVGRGDVIIVTPGTDHNLVNTGATPLKVFTTYVPPNHIDGRVHHTKAEAERDKKDQQFGKKVE